jgi:molydopterin dinucleotide binding protein
MIFVLVIGFLLPFCAFCSEYLFEQGPGPVAEIHPETAVRLGIADGDKVKVCSPARVHRDRRRGNGPG